MSQTILQQLRSKSLKEVEAYKSQVQKRKAELEAIKLDGKSWTQDLQDELDNTVMLIVDIDDIINEKSVTNKLDYKPAAGTEKMIHAQLVKGRRFNPLTGKEESTAFTQMFTFSEWQLFVKSYKSLGFTILAVLHNPYDNK